MTDPKVECTWGDGPDVLLTVEVMGTTVFKDLTAQEARVLADKLHAAAVWAEEMERECKEHDKVTKGDKT